MIPPDPAPATSQNHLAAQPGHLILPEGRFPGFALPEAVLHSIPLPTEFDELVRSAANENSVRTIFPKFFNALFRRQGVVNKHTIQSLVSVGQSLSNLAREIEGRDRILEKLTEHLNAYGTHVQRGQSTLAEHLANYGEQARQNHLALTSFVEQEKEISRTRSAALIATTRSLNSRLRELQNLTAETNERIAEVQAQAEKTTRDFEATFATTTQRTDGQMAELRDTLLRELSGRIAEVQAQAEKTTRDFEATFATTTQRTDGQMAELRDTLLRELSGRITEVQAQAEKATHDFEATLATTTQRTDGQMAELRDIVLRELSGRIAEVQAQAEKTTRDFEATFATTTQRTDGQMAELAARQVETQSLVAAARASARVAAEEVRRDAEGGLAGLTQRTDAQLVELRDSISRELTARLAEVQARSEMTIRDFEATLATSTQRTDGQLTELRDILHRELTKHPTEQALASIEERIAQIETRLIELNPATAQVESLASSIRATRSSHDILSADVSALRRELLALIEVNVGITRRQEATEVTLGGTSASLANLLPPLRAQLERLTKLETGPQRQAIANTAQKMIETAQTTESDAFYVALEARFRGPKALIRERQSKYIPLIEETRQRVEHYPPSSRRATGKHLLEKLRTKNGVLDLGCGRGEWLDLLKEHGVPCLGVDQNRFFLQACREREIEVVDTDLINFLRSAPDESVAVVTSFHVIEHLPIPLFQEMVRHVLRILQRGGTAIFETPNPTNMLTSSLNFLLDPTHIRPVHPQFASLVLETAGFTSVRLEFMSPYDTSYLVGKSEDPLAKRFNEYFYGPQDYAVIGIKP